MEKTANRRGRKFLGSAIAWASAYCLSLLLLKSYSFNPAAGKENTFFNDQRD